MGLFERLPKSIQSIMRISFHEELKSILIMQFPQYALSIWCNMSVAGNRSILRMRHGPFSRDVTR